MRYILLIPVFITLLVSCSKPDKNILTETTWQIHEMRKDGDVAMSLDPKEQDKMVEKAWKEHGAELEQMGKTREALKEDIRLDTKTVAGITFKFGKNGKVTVSSSSPGASNTVSPYKIDEEKKLITIQDTETEKLTYSYTITDDMLTLKKEKDEIIFKKK